MPSQHHPQDADRFTFEFNPVEELLPGQRWSSYWDVERLCRGPQPPPDWVVTDRAAIDTELGLLKTGKEADCLLIDRSVPAGPSSQLAAKRYRSEEHRQFHRSTAYEEGRRTRRTRDARAVAAKTTFGRAVAAGHWATAEFQALTQLWSAGVPVPYPVQIDGTELLMEFIGTDGEAAPRLAQTRPSPAVLAGYFGQLREAMLTLARLGWAHGDLSAYNVLALDDRLVIIDLPQIVDVIANPGGIEFLRRDCDNVCGWFQRRGLDQDPDELFSELLAHVF